MDATDMKLGQTKIITSSVKLSPQNQKELELAIAAITEKEYRGTKGFATRSGEEVSVINDDGKMNDFKVFKVMAGMLVLSPLEKIKAEPGLLDRLLLAYQIITSKFFEK